MSESFRILGKSPSPLKYNSVSTRQASLQNFLGDAAPDEVNEPLVMQPGELQENLEQRFNSGVNRSDIPRMWGYPDVIRKLANKAFDISNDVAAWRRNKGEPVK